MICSLLAGKLYIQPYCVLLDEQELLPAQQMVVAADKVRYPVIWPSPVTAVSVELIGCRLLVEMVLLPDSDAN